MAGVLIVCPARKMTFFFSSSSSVVVVVVVVIYCSMQKDRLGGEVHISRRRSPMYRRVREEWVVLWGGDGGGRIIADATPRDGQKEIEKRSKNSQSSIALELRRKWVKELHQSVPCPVGSDSIQTISVYIQYIHVLLFREMCLLHTRGAKQ